MASAMVMTPQQQRDLKRQLPPPLPREHWDAPVRHHLPPACQTCGLSFAVLQLPLSDLLNQGVPLSTALHALLPRRVDCLMHGATAADVIGDMLRTERICRTMPHEQTRDARTFIGL